MSDIGLVAQPVSGYSVETMLGCTIVRGRLPVRDMNALTSLRDPDDLVDVQVARRIGALLVIGSAPFLERLRQAQLPPGEAVQRDIDAAKLARLSQAAVRWLDGYQRGASSDALFSATTGVPVGAAARREHPRDGSSFAQCLELWRLVPEVQSNLSRAAALSAPWQRVVEHWAELHLLQARGDRAGCQGLLKKCEH